jgi:predicted AlkP superfamily phosphohydrolase/phosphomutase
MFVEIGIDRINHAFWKFFDKRHHSYKPGNKYENVIVDYYKFIDKEIEKLLKLLDDDTVVFIVSDHGAKPMKGAFCVNQWLIEKGYLTLKKTPKSGAELDDCDIDWANTKAWAWGGYYARIFLNIKGREKRGMILSSQYEAWRNRLKEELANVGGPDGEKWQTKVYKPEELFSNPKGEAADLLVYFDDLYWRAAGTIGYKSIYLPENDIGPDDAVHDWDGIFIMYNPTQKKERNLGRLSIYDFAPTVLDILGVEIPKDMKGKSIVKKEHIYV